MAWIYLIIAGMFEIGWPLGLKMIGRDSFYTLSGIILAGTSIALSGLFLYFAQRDIPMGTAYAAWTAIGSVGTFFVGVFFWRPKLAIKILRDCSNTFRGNNLKNCELNYIN